MPSIHYLNPPPHPFWDFVAGIEDHPFFGAYGQHPHAEASANPNNATQQGAAPQGNTQSNQQAGVEDPPEVDPSTTRPVPGEFRDMPFRGRGRFGNANPEERQRGPRCGGRGNHRGGPPPFEGPFGPWGGPMMFGPPWARGRRGPPHFRGHRHHHGPGPSGHQERSGADGQGFNLGQFLNGLGEKLGIDLSGAAENLGINQYTAPRNNSDADFEPRADIFDTAETYIVHLSLPGAKKEDVGVDWDGENSVLRVAGVVHRPGADEQLLSQLIVDGRKRETGVFEKAIRLGTKNEPANIDVAGISAKMTDGVLVVKVPKVEVEHKKRDVPISGTNASDAQRNEKDLLFDADEEMYDAIPSQKAPTQTGDKKDMEKAMAEHTKEHEEVTARDDRSETAGREEILPRYQESAQHEESDWEKDGSEDEGDYVKINVD